MAIQMIIEDAQVEQAVSEGKVDECQRCGNVYIVLWLKEADEFNDFGLRHCPFCGLLVDEITGSVCV
ncbi:hypothetical protein ACFL0Q_09480 [Thermodesulfobacteriota bacterium]